MRECIFTRPVLLLALLVFSVGVAEAQSHNCFTGCQTCETFFYFLYCTQCQAGRYLDSYSGLCPCVPGTYDKAGTCTACPKYCLACTQYSCTSCKADKYYSAGSCYCKNGADVDANGDCINTTTLNIAVILGICFGAAAGLVCILSVFIMLRKKNFRIFQQGTVNAAVGPPSPNAIVLDIQQDSDNLSAYDFILNPAKPIKFQFKSEICSICLQEQPLCMTECGHFFHERCIGEWIQKRHNCPNCCHSISRGRLVKWCGCCKAEPIYPQFYRLNSSSNSSRKEAPIFWPSCSKCHNSAQPCELEVIK